MDKRGYSLWSPWESFSVGLQGKGRGGGVRGGGGGEDDDGSSNSGPVVNTWHVPVAAKILFCIELLWVIVFLVQAFLIIKNLKRVQRGTRSSKGPYMLALFVCFVLAIYYGVGAVLIRIPGLQGVTDLLLDILLLSSNYLFVLDITLRPAVLLWITHLRGILSIGQEVKVNSFAAASWKKVLDWILIGTTFLVGSVQASVIAYAEARANQRNINSVQYANYHETANKIGHVIVALTIIAAINITATLIGLIKAQKRANLTDRVIGRLMVVSLPFVVVDGFETLIAYIWHKTQVHYDVWTFLLALGIIEGICRIMIISGVILGMKYSSTPLSAHPGEYLEVYTGDGGSQQPLYAGNHEQNAEWHHGPPAAQGYPYQIPYDQPNFPPPQQPPLQQWQPWKQ